jgi:uncharacterized protein YcbX
MAHVAELYRYPVKGLSPEPLESTALTPGEPIPFDRAYAIENGPSGFDPTAPRHFPKIAFLMLMRNERLAELRTHFDEATHLFTIRHRGNLVAEGNLETAEGRQAIEAFFEIYSASELRGPPRVLTAPPGHTFCDTSSKVVSVINLATVKAIGRKIGANVHPLRFRGNLYVEGLPAWDEFGWSGKRVTIGGAAFEVVKRTQRCAATNVDPETGKRDLAIPRSLMEAYGHSDCGVYLRVIAGGRLAVNDEIRVA